MDFSKVLLNPSRLGAVMSEPKGAMTDLMFETLEKLKSKEELTPKQELQRIELQFRMDNYDPKAISGGCKNYLMFLYQYLKYGNGYKKVPGKGIDKLVRGSKSEKASVELIKRVTGQPLFKHKKLLKNDYLKGQLDVIDSKEIETSKKIIDVKTSASHFSFMQAMTPEVKRSYNFQMHGYFALTGRDYGEVYHCLADYTEDDIAEEKHKMIQILCPDGIVTTDFEEEWAEAEYKMRYAYVPDEERIFVHPVERDEKIIDKIYEKVEFCREWLAEFEKIHLQRVADQKAIWQREPSSK